MKLIVDSGSTKTDWCFADSVSDYKSICTTGINPITLSANAIKEIIETQLMPAVLREEIDIADIDEVFFYGAGCLPEKKFVMKDALQSIMKNVYIEVDSDLLAAARALCGRNAGIACILGTGSNSCIYDGRNIVGHTPALGYILGDEGGGAVLGRNFINGIYKGLLPEKLREEFESSFSMTMSDIINRVYHSDAPNKFLASIARFISLHISENAELENMVIENFENFITKNIEPYYENHIISVHARPDKVINAVGSIAYYYRHQLEQAVARKGYSLGLVLKKPIGSLLNYHFIG